MKTQLTKIIFWLLVVVFILVIIEMLVPAVRELFAGSTAFLLLFLVFFILGIALILSTLKEKIEGKLKKFLLLTGGSAVGVLASIILHNVIYGLFIWGFGADFWERVGLGDEPVFFILGLIVLPIGFLVGVIGSIVLSCKSKKEAIK